MSTFNDLYLADLHRFDNQGGVPSWNKKFIYFHRKSQTCSNKYLSMYYRLRWKWIKQKHQIEISYNTRIGAGLYFGHPYNIAVNQGATIGENVNLHKGVTIGRENRGKRKGTPTIGNKVWVGINATLVGSIHIGNDVLIAPNSYVNFDVPDHSIVIGNPAIIKHRDNATEGYINSTVND